MSRILRHISAKDLKRTHQKKLSEQKELAAKKLKECQEAEEERKQIEEAAKPYKSSWREETQLQESDWSAISGSRPTNSTAQTFQYGGEGGPTATFSGLGGVEAYPSTVNVDGETLNTPNYSQLAMQGYAKPLGGVQRQTQQTTQQTENERIDAEIRKLEEQIKESKAKETAAIEAWNAELIATMDRHQREWDAVLKKDEVYNPEKHKGLQARHGAEMDAIWNKEPKTEPYETERQNLRTKIAELEKQRPKLNPKYAEQNKARLAELDAKLNKLSLEPHKVQQDFYDKWNKIKAALPPMPDSLGQYMRLDPVKALASWNLNAEERDYLKALAKYEKDFESAKKNDLGKKLDTITKEREALEKEYDYLLGMTPDVNSQLDASQEFAQNVNADVFMNARVKDVPEQPTFDVNINDPNNPEYNKRFAPITAADELSILGLDVAWRTVTNLYPDLGWTQQLAIDYARGNLRPRNVSPSPMFNAGVLKAIEHNLGVKSQPGSVSSYRHMNPLDVVQTATSRLAMGRYSYKVSSKGVEVTDFFDLDQNKNLGFFGNVPGLNQTAERLVDLGQRRAADKGYKMVHKMKNRQTGKMVEVPISPGDGVSPDGYGIPIKFTIPWSQVSPQLQNKLDPNQRFVPIVRKRNRRGRVVESTWSKLKKHR